MCTHRHLFRYACSVYCPRDIHKHTNCPLLPLPKKHTHRVPYTLDAETGELHIHLSRHYHPPKGHKYPIPAHKKDRFDRGLLLREDQLLMGLWRQKVRAKGKQVGCIFGEEVSEDLGCKVRKGGGRDGLVVGFGRKNVNAAKGRERRGKKRRG